ncbi:MAG: metallophosphoesterase [Thermoplasmata archaeon]
MQFMHELELEPGLLITAERGAILSEHRICVIADLHIGVEATLGIPANIQMKEMEERVSALIENYHIKELLINGDLKHTFSGNIVEEWMEIPKLLDYLRQKVNVTIVRGNHDNFLLNITARYGVEVVEHYTIGNFVFAHGHKPLPKREDSQIYILGHEHPAIKLYDRIGGYLKIPVFLWHTQKYLVLPAFSPWTYGHDLADGEVLVESVDRRDYLDAELFGCTDYGLLKLPKLREVLGAGRL